MKADRKDAKMRRRTTSSTSTSTTMSSVFSAAGASAAHSCSSSSSSTSRALVSSLAAAATPRSFSSAASTSQPKATSPKARRASEQSVRSAIELYHLAPSFFPTPAQTRGFGAALSPPEPEEAVHSRSLDAAIRSSIRVVADLETSMSERVERLRPGDNWRMVVALKPNELLDAMADPGPLRDGRAGRGPVYDPTQPAPLAGTGTGVNADARGRARRLRDTRVGDEAERSLDRIFESGPPPSSTNLPPSLLGNASRKQGPTEADSYVARSHLRFVAPRHPTAQQGAYAEYWAIQYEDDRSRAAVEEARRRYLDPTSERGFDRRGGAVAPTEPAGRHIVSAVEALDRSGAGAVAPPQAAGARGVSATAEADQLDGRAARIRDALFGTVAAELPGLEVLEERRRLRKLREE